MARILVIEDSPENLELMSYLLEAFGHVVLRATDGEQGIEIARRDAPVLIICDIHLPKMDGYEVAHQLKRNPVLCFIPLVAVTALAMVGDRDKVLAAGFDGYLAKPIVPKRFVEQVESYLRAPGSGSARQVPVRAAAIEEAPAPAAVSQQRQPLVLVVDDSPPNCELIRQTLEPAGYATRLVRTVHDGLLLARERVPDLIVSDLHLSGENGFDFLRQAKADPVLAAVPFIILTSSIWEEQDRTTALRLGAVRFLMRTITPGKLLEEIAACLPSPEENADGQHPGR